MLLQHVVRLHRSETEKHFFRFPERRKIGLVEEGQDRLCFVLPDSFGCWPERGSNDLHYLVLLVAQVVGGISPSCRCFFHQRPHVEETTWQFSWWHLHLRQAVEERTVDSSHQHWSEVLFSFTKFHCWCSFCTHCFYLVQRNERLQRLSTDQSKTVLEWIKLFFKWICLLLSCAFPYILLPFSSWRFQTRSQKRAWGKLHNSR